MRFYFKEFRNLDWWILGKYFEPFQKIGFLGGSHSEHWYFSLCYFVSVSITSCAVLFDRHSPTTQQQSHVWNPKQLFVRVACFSILLWISLRIWKITRFRENELVMYCVSYDLLIVALKFLWSGAMGEKFTPALNGAPSVSYHIATRDEG